MPTVLTIDDDESVRKVLGAVLRSRKFGVFLAATGETGLEMLAAGEFDVVLIDIFMPDMDGLATIRKIRTIKPQIPIIVMSGQPFTDRQEGKPDFLGMAVKLGAAEALQKPFRTTDLLAAIGRCLGDPISEADMKVVREPARAALR